MIPVRHFAVREAHDRIFHKSIAVVFRCHVILYFQLDEVTKYSPLLPQVIWHWWQSNPFTTKMNVTVNALIISLAHRDFVSDISLLSA